MGKRRQGFTLIELMVVMSIISFLSSIVLATVRTAREKALDARRKEDLNQILIALNLYYDDHGFLPHTSNTALGGDSDAGTWDYSSQAGVPDTFLAFLNDPKYFPGGVPVDPVNNGSGDVFYPALGGTGYAYAYHCYAPTHPSYPNTLSLGAKMQTTNTAFWIANKVAGYSCKP
jgi:prepilin-type N-terminal cleavage/methylation domain-containing protein